MQDYQGATLESLVRACATSMEAGAWDELVRRIQPVMATTVIRTAQSWTTLSRSLVDDLVQETYVKLCADQCRLLRNFREQHEGSFLGFIKVITANVVRDHFKSAVAAKRGSGVVATSLDQPGMHEPVSESESGAEHAVLIQQIHGWLNRKVGSDRDRLAFLLYYQGGLTAKEISALPGIGLGTKGVESLLCRLINSLRSSIARVGVDQKSKNQEGFSSE